MGGEKVEAASPHLGSLAGLGRKKVSERKRCRKGMGEVQRKQETENNIGLQRNFFLVFEMCYLYVALDILELTM